jgi:hypothetical protein
MDEPAGSTPKCELLALPEEVLSLLCQVAERVCTKPQLHALSCTCVALRRSCGQALLAMRPSYLTNNKRKLRYSPKHDAYYRGSSGRYDVYRHDLIVKVTLGLLSCELKLVLPAGTTPRGTRCRFATAFTVNHIDSDEAQTYSYLQCYPTGPKYAWSDHVPDDDEDRISPLEYDLRQADVLYDQEEDEAGADRLKCRQAIAAGGYVLRTIEVEAIRHHIPRFYGQDRESRKMHKYLDLIYQRVCKYYGQDEADRGQWQSPPESPPPSPTQLPEQEELATIVPSPKAQRTKKRKRKARAKRLPPQTAHA